MAPNDITAHSNNTQQKAWVNGQYRTVSQDNSGKLYVIIDGKKVEVDKNDLFGMNADITDKIDDNIEYGKEQVKYYSLLFNNAIDDTHDAREAKQQFLKEHNVSLISELDGEDYTKAKKLTEDISNAVTGRIRALAEILNWTHYVVSNCCDKSKFNIYRG